MRVEIVSMQILAMKKKKANWQGNQHKYFEGQYTKSDRYVQLVWP